MTLAAVIFGLTYLAIVTEKIDRTAVALAGGLSLVFLGVLSQKQAVETIDFNTLGLLIGMMVLVNVLRQTGVFRYVGIRTARLAGGRPWPVMLGFALFTAVASAFLDNVTTVLLMMPITLTIAEHLRVDARPMLVSQIIASNVGGTATLIGDPPNILIGSAVGLSFVDFLANLTPVVLVILALTSVGFWLVWGRKASDGPGLAALADLDEKTTITNYPLLYRSLAVLGLTILGFLLHGPLHLEPASVAMAGATILVLVGRVSIHRALEEVEWGTILFFVGLFVVVGALEKVGLLGLAARLVVDLTGGNLIVTVLAVLWFAAFASAIVDNIPAVASLIPVVFAVARLTHPGVPDEVLTHLPDVLPLWWALALGACLGGNATLVAASANVVVAGAVARRGEKITFWGFTKVGLPITLVSLVVASVYLYLRYL